MRGYTAWQHLQRRSDSSDTFMLCIQYRQLMFWAVRQAFYSKSNKQYLQGETLYMVLHMYLHFMFPAAS